MLKKISISFHLNSPNLNGFGNMKLINLLLCVFNNRSSGFFYNLSSKMGINTGFIIKESPFHYPIAKTVLSNSTRNSTLTSNVFVGYKKFSNNFYFLKKLYLNVFKTFYINTNSLITYKKTTVSLYINYKPIYN